MPAPRAAVPRSAASWRCRVRATGSSAGAVISHIGQTTPPWRVNGSPHTGHVRGNISDATSATISLNIDIDRNIYTSQRLLRRHSVQTFAQQHPCPRHRTPALDLEHDCTMNISRTRSTGGDTGPKTRRPKRSRRAARKPYRHPRANTCASRSRNVRRISRA